VAIDADTAELTEPDSGPFKDVYAERGTQRDHHFDDWLARGVDYMVSDACAR
jgi:hypothetical protein